MKNENTRVNELLRALLDGDREKEMFLNKDYDPLTVRDYYGKTLSAVVDGNYDLKGDRTKLLTKPEAKYNFEKLKQLYENPKLLENTKLNFNSSIPENAAASYGLNNNTVNLRPERLYRQNSIADITHELKHGANVKDPKNVELIKQMLDANRTSDLHPRNTFGLSNAEKVLENHHIGDSIFEREGLMRLLKGGKLGLVLPALKAAGIGALGYQALGIGNKAMAGDIGGAGMDAADLGTDLIPGVGEAKMAVNSPELGRDSDIVPEDNLGEKQKFNNRFKKMREIMGAE